MEAPVRIFAAVLLAAGFPGLFAQSSAGIPGCEAPLEVRQTIDEKLSNKALENLKLTDQRAVSYQVIDGLIAKYPHELEPYRQLIETTENKDVERYPALVERLVKQAEQHPDDPLALYLAADVLVYKDTPRAIQMLDKAKAEAPGFSWPNLKLAEIYASGKLVDKKKASDDVAAFFGICPSSTENRAQWILTRAGSAELQTRVAAALRARLAKETDPKRLEEYSTLWGLEFRTRPPQEHDALRKQVAADLQRLESLNSKPEAEWLAFLKDGYKQSGATAETITAKEDRIIEAFPHSEQAFGIVGDRWRKAHKEPEDQKDAAAWAKYDTEHVAEVKRSIARFTEYRFLQHVDMFYVVSDDPSLSEKEGIALLDDFLTESTVYSQAQDWTYLNAADFLAEHKWQPERVLELVHQGETLLALDRQINSNDDLTPEGAKDHERQWTYVEQSLAGSALRAAMLLGKPAQVEWLKASVDGPPPADEKIESSYWLNRGRLAALEGRKADALTYYQKALFTRLRAPQPYHGRLQDDLMDDARAAWKDTGGTETAWLVWSAPPTAKAAELAEGRWEKPTKTMPAFELADLSGKTWRLQNLEGKSVLINVWATWCGPCNAELPHLQKLYEKVKDRPDIQILTFDIDGELGLVAPFMKEKGYTFPVLPAYSFVTSLIDAVAIPQNWIVDPKGVWRWSQLGFDASDAQWGETMTSKLEGVKIQ
jgi:thiol-disulfide isomerase/thioredoxin